MDILFPWRKQQLKQHQPPPQDYDGNFFGLGGGGGGGGGSVNNHHSLPHPQEHMLNLRQSRGYHHSHLSSSGGGDGMRSSQMREDPSGSQHGKLPHSGRGSVADTSKTSGGNGVDMISGVGGGGTTIPNTRVQRLQRKQRQQYYQQQLERRRISRESEGSKMFPTDESERSLGSDLTDRTSTIGATGAAASGGGGGSGNGVGGGGSHNRRPLLKSKTVSSLSYHTTKPTKFLHQPPEDENSILLTPVVVSPVRQLLDVINMSIMPSSLRLASLTQAMEFFDHRDKNMHDAELREEGVAFVLYQKLGLVLQLSRCSDAVLFERSGGNGSLRTGILGADQGRPSLVVGSGGGSASVGSSSTQHNSSHPQSLAIALAVQKQSEFDKEIAMICSCLEMTHRANHDAIAQTWDECGFEVLPLLIRVLERPFQRIEQAVWMTLQEKTSMPGALERAVAMAVTRDQKLAVQKVSKVLAMYSLVPEAKQAMCDCKGMLHWLTRIIDTHYYNRLKPGAPVIGGAASKASERGVTRGASDADASTLSGADGETSQTTVEQAKRLEIAASATSGAGLYMTEAARFNTIATLTNLAAHEANRMRMLNEPGLLDNICRVVFNERSEVPKECAALAIMNLSHGDVDHVPEMANNEFVLETLLKLLKDDNPVTRRNAVIALFNAACSDENTVRLARYRDGIVLDALMKLVSADNPAYHGDDEARANASETLFNMACSTISETTDRMANHAGLLECLAVTLHGEYTKLETKMYCSATLRRMAEIIHYPMIAQGALLSALVKASTWTSTDCIAEAFHSQAKVRDNRIVMARHHGLLNALSRLALTLGDGQDIRKIRMASCMTIELMSREEEARKILSQNEGIIMALTHASYRTVEEVDNDGAVTDGESKETDDDNLSMQSRMIQLSLKNLLSAM